MPELAIFVEIDGRLVGATFGLLDYNPRIKEIDGRLFPFGFIHLLRNKSAIKKIRLISTNVLPEYQMQGLGLVLMHGIVPKAIEWGMQEAEFSWVLESNSFSRGALTKGGAKITKTYRVYDIDFDPAEVAAQRQSRRRAAVAGRLEIRPVVSGRDLNAFLKVPWPIYAEDPQWVPQLLLDQKEFLNPRKHPFYLHGAAEKFIAYRDGVPQGRILVSDDPRYNAEHKSNTGCFGMFESADDPEMAQGPDRSRLEMAARPRPDGDPRSDRLFDQLHLRPAGRRLPYAAADHGQPQSALLRRAAGIVRPGKGQGSL